mmetsp:Transcript_97181/g.173124  ORF Transcript_97181/g.173124 Transcript_97181/m.173124 type:complete len:330 (-) Transcript_97181:2576-3565(-)
MDSSIMICICCTAERSVQRPWRMISTTEPMEGVLVVKGAAVEASPSWTIGVSISSRPSIPSVHLAAPAAKALPCFFCCNSCSFLSSVCRRAMTVFIAAKLPMTPVSSPRSFRFSSSSASHSCCLDIKSLRFLSISTFDFCAISIAFFEVSFRTSSRASSALSTFSFAGAFEESTLAFPKPLSSARPTSASFSAPTSFPPSPHMKEYAFSHFRTAWITCSFWKGDIRAKIFTPLSWVSTAAASAPCRILSSGAPVMMRSRDFPSSAKVAALNAMGSFDLPSDVIAGRHSTPPSLFSVRTSASSGEYCAMAVSIPTLRAVRGASPVSITQV